MFGSRRRDSPHGLAVGMTGVKMGDRFLQIGCPDGGRMGAIAAVVGLSGRAVAIVADEAGAARARKGAASAGVLVEVEIAQLSRLPLDDAAFDLAIVDDTGNDLGSLTPEGRVAAVREALRVLRSGGRLMVIRRAPRGGLGALFSRGPAPTNFDPLPLLQADGFRSVRTLAECEGLVFAEGVKPRT